ncbi:endonuclease/exonuclease/phosphatase family protein [Aliishimia ponticola]|uniref:endonuclease/exonuclease/phosphatase family protein n=1 Tax=Aliishimia ponticola TaxID=2499833 RepID=UPI001FE2F1CE|nr:endonuclease/exonuclease/phosphatase family protein [Aliishimia ponticola]
MLLRDIQRGKDAQVTAVVDVIAQASPDILVLRGIDWDLEARALDALAEVLITAGHPLPHRFTAQPNRGMPTGFDLNGNGRAGDPDDMQGYAEFTGQNGLAILSRWPIGTVTDATDMLWRDLPNALVPWPGQPDGSLDVLRLSSTAHWLAPIDAGDYGEVTIGTFAASTPVFDGEEDRNGRRNHDEIAFWAQLLDGALPYAAPADLIIAGHANLDPLRGDGRREAIRGLLDHPALQDPFPADILTVDWKRDDLEPMRLSYILPTQSWDIVASGVIWPEPGDPWLETVETASRHRLIWVDLERRSP